MHASVLMHLECLASCVLSQPPLNSQSGEKNEFFSSYLPSLFINRHFINISVKVCYRIYSSKIKEKFSVAMTPISTTSFTFEKNERRIPIDLQLINKIWTFPLFLSLSLSHTGERTVSFFFCCSVNPPSKYCRPIR